MISPTNRISTGWKTGEEWEVKCLMQMVLSARCAHSTFVSSDVWVCWCCLGDTVFLFLIVLCVFCVPACVCAPDGWGLPLCQCSSWVMGHNESEPNQCALPPGFIPTLALSSWAPAEVDGPGSLHYLAKADVLLSTTHTVSNQSAVS